ncbi:MAG: diphthamide biosynthesis enzyme Dph2 [Thermoplasmata archaeon]|nr:diphthamide biosynthesis enzyme Dph2 [Thermoplasmata archaeon]
MLENYLIDWESIVDELKRKNAKKVLIELPEGVKSGIFEIEERLKDFDLAFSGENVYGACDTINDMEGFDAVLHFGHSRIPNLNYSDKVIFVEMRRRVHIDESKFEIPGFTRIGLLATIQYLDLLPKISDILKRQGKSGIISRGDERLTYPGQVLGCDFSAATMIKDKVDCFLVIADGEFHANGIAISTGKETFALDPNTGIIKKIDTETFIRKRYAMVEKAMNAKNIGIIVSKKIGQKRFNLAKFLKEKIEGSGRKASIIMMDEITPQKLANFPFDIYVNTACPRISLDDAEIYDFKIVTPQEIYLAIGEKPLDKYTVDMINEL